MLFVLDRSIGPACDAVAGPEIEALQNLLLAVHKGVHALVAPYDILLRLSRNRVLAERERAIALRLANRSAELPILDRAIKYKVVVVGDDESISDDPTGFTYSVKLKLLGDIPSSPSIVLAENSIDAELFMVSAQHSRIHNRLTSLAVNGLARGGGGSQIYVELDQIYRANGIAAAITDGDIRHPHAPKSDVSKKCDLIVARKSAFCWHRIIPAHEIENIIPLNVYGKAIDLTISGPACESLRRLDSLVGAVSHNPIFYVCYKSGRRLCDCMHSSDLNEKNYWRSVADNLRVTNAALTECVKEGACLGNSSGCQISHGFGKNALHLVKSWLEITSHHKSLEQFKKSEAWMSLGKFVFDITVAFRRESI